LKYDEFITQVQRGLDFSSRDEAELATRATLETLGERLAGGEPKDLASQLPPEIGVYLLQPLAGTGQDFSLDEFFQRVSVQEGMPLTEGTYHARVIIALLSEIVTMGEIDNVKAQLPTDFRQLFEVEYEGQVPGQGVIDASVIGEEE